MSSIDVSVVIPTFRREWQVLEAIGSVLSQSGVALEVLVLDDSPEASARDAVATVSDPRVRYIARSEPSKGRPALVRNEGAQLASGRYLYFLDDDDVLEPGTLATMMQALEGSGAGMAFGVITPFGNDPVDLAHQQQYFRAAAALAPTLRSRWQMVGSLVFHATVLVNSACMARRSSYLDVGGYDGDIVRCEDVELWSRIVRRHGFAFVNRSVVRYRTGESSLMHDPDVQDKMVESYRRWHAKYRATHGLLEFYGLKLWARTLLTWRVRSGSPG